MAVFNVATTDSLLATLKSAKDGDTIALEQGDYSGILIKNLNIAGNVTITSADASKPAVLHDLLVKNSSGLTFSNLEMAETVTGKHLAFQVVGSNNITLDHLNVHGPDTVGTGLESAIMMVRSSNNVTVSNSEFSSAWHGLSMLDNTNITVKDNYFHNIRTDGVRGGGNSNLTITGNMFTDFHPAEGDHPDAIQLWTTNTSTVASNISISNNLVVRGNGDPIQGVFINDIEGKLPYENLSITGNLIVGGRYNGISVDGAASVTIAGNQVAGFAGETSWIRTQNVATAEVRNNASTGYAVDLRTVYEQSGNRQTLEYTDKGQYVVQHWLAANTGFGNQWANSVDALMDLFGLDAATPLPEEPTKVQEISGTDGDDRLTASDFVDSIVYGGAGDDVLTGHASRHHILDGGAGSDVYAVDSANTKVVEGRDGGTDTVRASVDFTLGEHVENLELETGGLVGKGNALANRIIGSDGNDEVHAMAGDDTVQLGAGDDVATGGDGNDVLRGEEGNDRLDGGAGNDTLLGGDGDDTIIGGAGNDTIEAGGGNDIMSGGAGNDLFRFRQQAANDDAVNVITDYQRGEDRISLSLIDANTTTAANDAFTFIGVSAFHKVAGELRVEYKDGASHLMGDTDGDGLADFTLILEKTVAVTARDFML